MSAGWLLRWLDKLACRNAYTNVRICQRTPMQTDAPQKPVRQRLIEAGERLFAEHGWNVGIRAIAAEAEVSLAALNYHFGEKETLLAEIFAARARPIAEERLRLIRALRAKGSPTLEAVIEAFLRPALTAAEGFGGKTFVKLRARLATEPEEFSRRILARAFDESGREYLAALQDLLPHLAPEELAWRFHFLLGAMVYTMANPGRIQSMTDGRCDPGDVATAMLHIVPFLAAGFRATPAARKRAAKRNLGGNEWTPTSTPNSGARPASPARTSKRPPTG
jgi:AcrR family transcriptional regulator